MNRIYRTVWNETLQAWVAVAEVARARSRGALGAASVVGVMASFPALVMAQSVLSPLDLPSGGNVIAGSAALVQSGAVLDVHQTTTRAAIDWQSFNVGSAATVNFLQPSSSSVTLNRVLDSSPSQIFGRITAPGQVFLTNAAGIYFAPGASVDVGGLVASTRPIGIEDFMAGNYRFEGGSAGQIVNQGHLNAGDSVALIAARIVNEGDITAGNQVLIGAGNRVTLDLGRAVALQIEEGALDAQIEQGGAVRAEGGTVLLTARALDALSGAVIRHDGVTEASSLTARGGRIVLEADHIEVGSGSRLDATGPAGGGEIIVGGGWQGSGDIRQATTVTIEHGATLDASATDHGDGGTVVAWSDIHNADSVTRAYGTFLATGGPNGGDGGRIETSGHWLDTQGAQGSAAAPHGKAGEWLFDPYDVTITTANLNGSFSSGTWTPSGNSSTILNTDINALLEGGTNVTITTGSSGGQLGDITVDAAVTKGSGNTDVTLTMRAANSIVVNQAINNTGGSGKLHVALDADNNNGTRDGAGIVLLNNSIGTGGGNIDFGTGATMSIGGVTTKVGGDVYVGGSGAIALTTGGGSVTINGETIIANTSGLSISTSGGNVTFGGLLNSGNTYAGVSYAGTWEQAKTNAASGTGSATGDTYLATITSRLENAVAGRAVNYNPSWLGGRRVTGVGTDSQWRWVTGPEASQDTHGLIFFTQSPSGSGTTVSGLYSNWNSGEPNNWGGGTDLTHEYESVLQFTGSLGNWNDLTGGPTPYVNPPQSLSYYVKETNLASSPLTINAGAGSVTFSGAVGTSKALASLNVSATGGIAINGGAVTTQSAQTYNNNITLGAASTTLTQTNANTDFTLQSSRSISNATAADATLTVKTTGAIILGNASSISSSTGKLNTVLWSDSDGDASGYIQAGNGGSNATISTNGGHLWMGGGSGSTTWNGLTVGNANAVGNAAVADGIYLYNAGINTNGGNIAMYGEGRNGAAACGAGSSCTADGIKFRGTDSIDSGAGTLYMYGKATSTDKSANGIELGHPGETTHTITSANSTAGAITLEGYAGTTTGADAWGVYTWATTIAATSGGGITLKGSGTKNAGVTVASGGAVLANSGNITLQGTGYGATTPYAVLIQGNVGQKAGTSVTASTSNIDIIGDTLSVSGTVQSSGALSVRPNTGGTTIGIAGGAGTLLLPASYFATNFVNGFSGITIGSNTAGDITIGTTALTYNDPMTLKTAGNIIGTAGTSITGGTGSNSLVLWADADATNGGYISLPGTGTAINIDTNGGHLWMGGGSGSATWNGLTVGDGRAIGMAAQSIGIFLHGTTVNTDNGNIALYGDSGNLAAAGGDANSHTEGIRFGGTNSVSMNSGTGNILLDGVARGTSGWGIGIEFDNSGGASHSVTSAAAAGNAITLVGDASGENAAASSTTGIWLHGGTTLSATGGGGISFTGTGGNHATYNEAIWGADGASTVNAGSGSLTLLGRGKINMPTATITAGTASLTAENAAQTTRYNITANKTTNNFSGTVSATGANISLIDSDSLSLGTITSTGTIDVATLSGNLTLTGAVSTTNTTASAITLNAGKNTAAGTATGGNILVSGGSVSTGSGGRATLYTGSVFGSTGLTALIGSGSGNFRYNSDESVTNYTTALGSGNYAIYREQPTISVAAASTSITYGDSLPTYTASYSGLVNGDTGSSHVTGTANWSTAAGTTSGSGHRIVGSYDVSYSSGLASGLGYGFTDNAGSTGELVVTAKALSLSGLAASNKTYDGTTAASVSSFGSLAGIAGGDTVGLDSSSAAANFADRNAGTGKTVTVASLALSGVDAGNYSIADQTTTADIAVRTLTVGYTGVNRVYDGTADATVTTSDDRVGGDILTINRSAGFADKHVGTGKTVSVSGVSLGGADAGNYVLASTTGSTTADIAAKALSLSGFDAGNKTYDGTVTATINNAGSLSGVVTGDAVTVSNTGASFSDKNAGTGKTVTLNGVALGGPDAGNYSIADQTTTADIAARTLTVGYTGVNRVYDGTTDATVTTSDDRVGGDTLTINRSAGFADKHVGTGKTVSVSGVSLGGADAGNYVLASTTGSTTADITAKALSLSGLAASNKTYDGTTAASVSSFGSLAGIVGGDTVGLDSSSAAANFADRNAGTGKTVTVASLALSGVDAGNYSIADQTTTADITARVLNLTGSRSYDGTTAVAASIFTVDTGVSGESLTLAGSGSITDRNVGTGKAVTVGSLALGDGVGGSASNYTLSGGAHSADITAFAITVSADAKNKTVGEADPAFTYTGSGSLMSGDSYIGTLVRDPGEAAGAYAINQGTLAIDDGNGGNNYALTYAGADLSITDAPTVPPPPAEPAPVALPQPEHAPAPLNGDGDSQAAVMAETGVGNPAGVSGSMELTVPEALQTGVVVHVVRDGGVQENGIISVSVPKGMAVGGEGFRFVLPEVVQAVAGASAVIVVTLADGSPLPAWLNFDAGTRSFITRTIPEGALPIELRVSANDRVFVVTISERTE